MLSRSRAFGPKMVPTMVRAAMSRLPTAEKFLPALRRMLLRESKYAGTTKTQRHKGRPARSRRIRTVAPVCLCVFVSLWFLRMCDPGFDACTLARTEYSANVRGATKFHWRMGGSWVYSSRRSRRYGCATRHDIRHGKDESLQAGRRCLHESTGHP